MKDYLQLINYHFSDEGTVHYVINSTLYLITLKEKYIQLHEKLLMG